MSLASVSTISLSTLISKPRELNLNVFKNQTLLFVLELTFFCFTGIIFALLIYFGAQTLLFPPQASFPENKVEPSQAIIIKFSQPISRKDLKLSISPASAGKWSFNQPLVANRLYQEVSFTPSLPYKENTVYTISIENLHSIIPLAKAKSLTYQFKTNLQKVSQTLPLKTVQLPSLPSVNPVSTLEQNNSLNLIENILLAVPAFKQKYNLSCEFASMRMALAFKGISKSEDQLIAETPFDNTPHDGDTWGDPEVGFVGSVNGTYFETGYGAYHTVVANELAKYRPVDSHENWDISSLIGEIKAGNPVIIWGCTYCIGPRYWTTPTGKQIRAYEYYHMYTVVGYAGTVAKPTSIEVNNPISGLKQTFSIKTFKTKWAAMGNTAVVVK